MSSKETLEQFGSCWEGLEDPRCGNAALHDFHELLMIALCCVLCGGQGAVDMAVFAEAKEPFLRSFLTLTNGLPSHDTFSRLFRNLDPDQFRNSLQRFVAQFSGHLEGVVAIDGKVLRRSFDRVGPAHGQCLGLGAAAGVGADRHRCQVQRDYGSAQTAQDAGPQRHHRDRRCTQLPARHRRANR
jgi:hypothetical protein